MFRTTLAFREGFLDIFGRFNGNSLDLVSPLAFPSFLVMWFGLRRRHCSEFSCGRQSSDRSGHCSTSLSAVVTLQECGD